MTEIEHKFDFIYFCTCAEHNCKDNYIGGTGRTTLERITDGNDRCNNSYCLSILLFMSFIIVSSFWLKVVLKKNYLEGKVSETLFI